MRLSACSALVIGLGLAACGREPPQDAEPTAASAAAPMSCEALASLAVPNTTITTAETVPAGSFQSPVPEFPGFAANYSSLPVFCRVAGTIKPTPSSDIRFELWLPADGWNGRFMQTGNGAAAGSIVYGSLIDPLARGYAVANTDTGHQGGGGDFGWAAGEPEKLADYAYRAVHELTLAGKVLTTARYGRAPEKSYWVGCSTGGRQGLKAVQRYPEDYDAVVAGAPANHWSRLMASSILIQRNLGEGGLGVDKLGLLKEAAIAACDADDGLADRVIAEPGTCAFDPASLACANGASGQCLSPTEVAAARRIYAGVVNEAGEVLFPGTGPGSEPAWAAYASPQFAIGTSYFRNAVAKDPAWDPATFDVETDLARAEAVDGGATIAMDPDLSAFVARDGKLLLYHGTTDGLIPYGNTVNYYESVVATLGAGAVDDNVKLYLVPGMDHCAGGEGAFAVDWLSALEDWAERGETPGALPATRPPVPAGAPGAAGAASAGAAFSRPVCPYPQMAKYRGSGDPADAASFACVGP